MNKLVNNSMELIEQSTAMLCDENLQSWDLIEERKALIFIFFHDIIIIGRLSTSTSFQT